MGREVAPAGEDTEFGMVPVCLLARMFSHRGPGRVWCF